MSCPLSLQGFHFTPFFWKKAAKKELERPAAVVTQMWGHVSLQLSLLFRAALKLPDVKALLLIGPCLLSADVFPKSAGLCALQETLRQRLCMWVCVCLCARELCVHFFAAYFTTKIRLKIHRISGRALPTRVRHTHAHISGSHICQVADYDR